MLHIVLQVTPVILDFTNVTWKLPDRVVSWFLETLLPNDLYIHPLKYRIIQSYMCWYAMALRFQHTIIRTILFCNITNIDIAYPWQLNCPPGTDSIFDMSACTSCQIRKIAGCACAGNVFPTTVGQRSRHASRQVHDARAVMHDARAVMYAGIAN